MPEVELDIVYTVDMNLTGLNKKGPQILNQLCTLEMLALFATVIYGFISNDDWVGLGIAWLLIWIYIVCGLLITILGIIGVRKKWGFNQSTSFVVALNWAATVLLVAMLLFV